MPDQRVKIGFVGVGNMGQCAHLKNYVMLENCEVVAIAEVRESLGKKVAARYGVPHVFRSSREMFDHAPLDGVVVSQPFNRHGVLLPEILRAGLPVFTEKPLAASLEVGERIVEAVKASGTWHMVGYHKRSDPAVMYARQEIDRLKQSGELGKMTYARITMPPGDWIQGGFDDLIRENGPLPTLEIDPLPSNMDAVIYSRYTTFVNYYIHQVNLLRHLLGEPYRVTYAEPSGILLVGESVSGVPCVIEMAPYQTTVDWQESALVCFERGTIRIDLPAPLVRYQAGQVELFADPGAGAPPTTVRPQLPRIHAMMQQATNFIAAIRGQAPPPCEAAEALEDLRMARDYIRKMTGG